MPARAGLDLASRRAFVVGIGVAPLALFSADLFALQDDSFDPKKLKPGQFLWEPERSPEGPIVIVVSIPDQLVTVYRQWHPDRGFDLLDRPAGPCHPDGHVCDPREGRRSPLLAL